jgi:phenylalanyl-tRNA synthetase beta chain
MAIVAFDVKDFKGLDTPQDKIEEALLKMGVEIEERTDAEIKLNITPNRPDLLDFGGLARAIQNFTGRRTPQEKFYKIKGPNQPVLTIQVGVEMRKIRPYIAGIVIRNADLSGNILKYLINFTEKFADTYGRKRKKLAIGIHDLDKIKGNLNYTAVDEARFIPLNSTKEMTLSDILKDHEKGIAYSEAIKKGKKTLFPILKDTEKIIAFIPITNSEATKVTNKSKDLFIDITGTSLKTIREAAAMIACTFLDAGAEVSQVAIDYNGKADLTPVLEYAEVKLPLARARRTLGVNISEGSIVGLANKMGYVAAQYGKAVLFLVPPYRVDVLNEQDIIEDLAIAYGYDNIEPLPVVGSADGLAQELMEYENNIASMMVGLGYTEAINTLLTNENEEFESMGMKDYDKNSYLSIAEARTSNLTMLRKYILPGLLGSLRNSSSESMPQRMFELGRVFSLKDGAVTESISLGFVSEHSKANFSEIKASLESVLRYLGVDKYKISEHKDQSFIEGRCAAVEKDGNVIGLFGELHPIVLENFGLEEPVVAAEIKIVGQIKYDA